MSPFLVRGLLIGNAWGNHEANKVKYGLTLAHEVGHILGYQHREPPPGYLGDGLTKPHDKNLMDIFVDGIQREDLDLIQSYSVQYAKVFVG
jgi:hypothetical protein